jgi:hypothetical protein
MPVIAAPANGVQFPLNAPTAVTFSWTAVTGASQYLFEFTGSNRAFASANGSTPDTVNGLGGAGGGVTLPMTGFATTLDPSFPLGTYQVRVLGMTAIGLPVGVFSNATTVVLGLPVTARPTITAPGSGSRVTRGNSVTVTWTGLPGITSYGFEFTGANRQFANPNGTAADPVNGFGGAGGALLVNDTTLTVAVPGTIPPGTYEARVIGLSVAGQPVGSFSNAIVLIVQ